MIRLRTMAGSILTSGSDLLLMRRSPDKDFYPGVWAAVGGHMEPSEINDPQAACLRELIEETGLSMEDLSGLALRYIVLRRSADEIRVSHVFIAEALRRDVSLCDEGELHWVAREAALDRPMSAFTRLVLERYLERGIEKDVLVGALLSDSDTPHIDWVKLAAWNGL